MKHFFAAGLVVCALLGIGALTPSGAAAAVRHISINHLPAPPFRTVEISTSNPTPTAVPPQGTCVGAPPKSQVAGIACSAQSQPVQVTLVQVPVH